MGVVRTRASVPGYDYLAFQQRTGCRTDQAIGYGCWGYGEIASFSTLSKARKKPRNCSDARWRMELSRRRREAIFGR